MLWVQRWNWLAKLGWAALKRIFLVFDVFYWLLITSSSENKLTFEKVFPPLSSLRIETLQIQGSNTPVIELALILHTKENFFLQRTQFCCTSSLDDKMAKSPPSISRILQKSTPLTKGTAVSSSNVKCTWNLNFFFFIIKDIVPSCWSVLIVWWRPINENREKVNKYTVFGCKAGAENPLLQCESFLKNCLDRSVGLLLLIFGKTAQLCTPADNKSGFLAGFSASAHLH